jgi:hypothetical protein
MQECGLNFCKNSLQGFSKKDKKGRQIKAVVVGKSSIKCLPKDVVKLSYE